MLIVIHCPWDKWGWCGLCICCMLLVLGRRARVQCDTACRMLRQGWKWIPCNGGVFFEGRLEAAVNVREKARGRALAPLFSNLIPHGGKHWAVNLAASWLAAEVMGRGLSVWGPQLFWKSLCRYLQHVYVWSTKDESYFSREPHICQVYCPIIPIHLSTHWMPIRFTGWCRYTASGRCQCSAAAELLWLATAASLSVAGLTGAW